MDGELTVSDVALSPARPGELSSSTAFSLQASLMISFLAGSSATTPLFPVYQSAWHVSPVVITVIFGIYAIAVLCALLVAGRLSDFVGRRPVLLVATFAQAVTMILFALAGSSGDMIVSRVIQGLTTGAAVAAIGAAMLDLDKVRGTIANAVAPVFGTATGAIISGVMVKWLPAPTHLVFVVMAVIFAVQFVGLLRMGETLVPKPGALASCVPQFRLPAIVRRPFLVAVPVLIAAWSLTGFFGALGPMVLRSLLHSDSSLISGLALFVFAGSGGLAILFLRNLVAPRLLSIGTASLFSGAALIIAAVSLRSTPLFFVAGSLAGIGFGAGFQGAVRTIMPFVSAHERAGVLSLVFVVSYVSMGVPAILGGYRVAVHGDVIGTAQLFGVCVLALSGMALFATQWRRKKVAKRCQLGPPRRPGRRH